MPRDGSGNYSLPSGNPVTTGTTISSTTHNSTQSDIASALTASVAKDGQTTMTGNLPMGGFRPTGVGDASAATQCPVVSQTQKDYGNYVGTVGGTGDAITLTAAPAITAYAAGDRLWFIATASNTGATTVNVNSLGAKNITKYGTKALNRGDIVNGRLIEIRYDGTQFVLVEPSPVFDRVTTLSEVVNTVTETTVYSVSVPANILSTGGSIRLELTGDYLNNSGSSVAMTAFVKFGTTTIATFNNFTSILTDATRRAITMSVVLTNESATNAQSAVSNFWFSAPRQDGEDVSDLGFNAVHTSCAEDTTSAKTLAISVQHGTAASTISFRMRTCFVELL